MGKAALYSMLLLVPAAPLLQFGLKAPPIWVFLAGLLPRHGSLENPAEVRVLLSHLYDKNLRRPLSHRVQLSVEFLERGGVSDDLTLLDRHEVPPGIRPFDLGLESLIGQVVGIRGSAANWSSTCAGKGSRIPVC